MSVICSPRIPARSRQSGVGLIEVLIAVLIMAIGMLGIAALQATALRNSQSSLERSQAVVYSYAMFDAMRANLPAARAGQYDMAMQCNALTGGTLAQDDRSSWLTALKQTLGDDTCGQIACAAVPGGDARNCTITVRWNDSRGTEGAAQQTLTTQTRI